MGVHDEMAFEDFKAGGRDAEIARLTAIRDNRVKALALADAEIANLRSAIDQARRDRNSAVECAEVLRGYVAEGKAEIAKLRAEVASLQTEDGKRTAALRHAAGMVLAYADAEDRMADECRTRSLGENAVLTRCRVRNILKRVADRIATDQPVTTVGGYDSDALGDRA